MSSFIVLCDVPESEASRLNDWLCSLEVQTISGPRRVGNLFEYGFSKEADSAFAKEFFSLVNKHKRLNIPSKIHKIE